MKMNKSLKEILSEQKQSMNAIHAPENMEDRLKKALAKGAPKRVKRRWGYWKSAVAVIIVFLLLGNHYNALAYYSKKLLGFDELLSGTLKELNDDGVGQTIEQQMELLDGTILIIDGIMTDANGLIMYYTLRNEAGVNDETADLFQPRSITGFMTNSMEVSGVWSPNENYTEIKGIRTFESVSPFAKKLTLHFNQMLDDVQQQSSITFDYNPNQAMKTVIKQSINKKIVVDQGTIKFESLTATPTKTVIKGVMDVDNLNKVNFALGGIELVANGEVMESLGGGTQSSISGVKFEVEFDALPEQLQSLQLVVKQFVGYEKLDTEISLQEDQVIAIGEKEIKVKAVQSIDRGIEVTIATEPDIRLEGVYIVNDDGEVELETTVNQHLEAEDKDGLTNVRTLIFNSNSSPRALKIAGMHYMKDYDIVIDIPVK